MKTVMGEGDSEDKVYYIPAPRGFENTRFVKHKFASGSMIKASVIPSQVYSEGADIELEIIDSDGKTACKVVLDKFSSLCLVDAIVKNLVNQEELVYDATRRSIISRNSS